MFLLLAVALLAVTASVFFLYLQKSLNFWKSRRVPILKSSVLFGDFFDVIAVRKSIGECCQDIYHAFGDNPVGGVRFFWKPLLMVKDPELLKQVFVKDFSNFHSRGFFYDEEKHPMSAHLFALDGPAWRRMRVKLTPTFTTGKMKIMFDTMASCATELQALLEETVKVDDVVDIREMLARLGTDIISSVAFGIQCNSIRNPDAEFRNMGRKVFQPTLMLSIRNLSYFFLHSCARFFNLPPTDSSVTRFMTDVVYETVAYREKNGVSRPDFLNLLIEMKNSQTTVNSNRQPDSKEPEKDTRPITMSEILAQVFVFFIAGFETTSSTTGFTLYELARHLEIQQRVRREIDEALKRTQGKVTYELLTQMLPYTDQVVNETLRCYPAVPFLTRQASSDVELSRGPREPPVVLSKGDLVAISVSGLHTDPKYFPDPQRFDPDRFSPENVAKRPGFVYLPFGEGPRICIGMRFGLVQVKLAMVTILSRFIVQMSSRTSEPLKLDPRSTVPFPEGGLYLRLVPRDDLVSTAA